MKKLVSAFLVFLLTATLFASPNTIKAKEELFTYAKDDSNLSIDLVGHFDSGSAFDDGGTEIVAFDPVSNRMFSINGSENALDIINISNLNQSGEINLPLHKRVKLEDFADELGNVSDITSVALHPEGEYLALSVPAEPKTDPGFVVLTDKDGNLLNYVKVGALPDMLTFTPDGKNLLVANEGEPNDDYTVNPLGSVAIINVEENVENISNEDVDMVTFEEATIDSSVRKVHPDTTYAEDLEPEYIVVDGDSKYAYVVLQEDNAIAKFDIEKKTFDDVTSLGYKDHSLDKNALDVSNKDDQVNIQTWPVLGTYQPDGMSLFEANGKTYIITPNEGDAQDYDGFSEEVRVKDIIDSYDLKAEHFEGYTQAELDELIENGLFDEDKLGRLKTTTSAPKNEDGKYEAVYAYGARSFTIWDAATMTPVYDSGKDFEEITAKALPNFFNSTNDEDKFDNRSDDKGPEPETATVGQIGSSTYAFVGLERVGGIMVYDVTNPNDASFDTYFSSRDFGGDTPAGDIAPEGLKFVPADMSPTGNALVIAAHEVSGTIAVYEITQEDRTEITILHTNDSHSRVFEGDYDGMGFAKLSTLVKQQEAQNKNTLLLDAGDTFHGQTFATLEKGKSIVEIMNSIGYDGMAAGNHDFNYGYDRLLELSEMADFPVLSANVVVEETGELLLPPYIIKEVDGIKLGIFGLSTPETHFKTHPKNVEGLKFTDPVAAANKMVKELQGQNVDAIIGVSHLGTDASSTDTSIKVAQGAPGIDVIVDGHSHTVENIGESGTLIVSAGEYLKNLGVLELAFVDGELVSKNSTMITKEDAADIKPDAAVEQVIEEIETAQQSILDEVVGKTSVELNGEREDVRTGETNLGNLITDAMIDVTGAEVAITNGGGIRASIGKGDITKGDVITVLPFGNYIVTKNVLGKDIKAALETGVSAYPNTLGGFPQVAGMTFQIDQEKPAGERVHSIKINGQAIDLNKEYELATNDFMAAGGDNYTMFTDYAIKNEYPALDEAVISYIKKQQGTVKPEVEDRIVVEAAKNSAEEPEEKTYIIQPGDWLSKIAEQHDTTWQVLKDLNKIENAHLIYPGQEIILP